MEDTKSEEHIKHHTEHHAEKESKQDLLNKITKWHIITAVLVIIIIALVLTKNGSAPATSAGDIIILNDKTCFSCDTAGLEQNIKKVFPESAIKNIDYSSAEGKALFKSAGLTMLPAVLFDNSVTASSGYSQVSNYLEQKGSYLSLRIGSNYDPTKPEIKNKLDVFVMSQCPYGTKALDAANEVLTNFDGIDFDINYIAEETSAGVFNSLHGQGEVDEDMRELCAIKYYPANYQYMKYITCRNKDIKSTDWQPCATSAGMDAAKIKTCFEGTEGKTLLSTNIKKANELSIGASPTWLANNKYTFSGIDAETIKTQYCKANPNAKGCENTLSTDAAVSGSCG